MMTERFTVNFAEIIPSMLQKLAVAIATTVENTRTPEI